MRESIQTNLGVHSNACAFSGQPYSDGSLAHDLCCCDPDGSKEQKIQDFINRHKRRNVIYQKKVWYNAGGQEIRLKEMTLRYKQNVLGFLWHRAAGLKLRAELELAVQASDPMIGDMAGLSLEHILGELMEQSVEEWFDELPLVKSLRKRIAKGQDGSID